MSRRTLVPPTLQPRGYQRDRALLGASPLQNATQPVPKSQPKAPKDERQAAKSGCKSPRFEAFDAEFIFPLDWQQNLISDGLFTVESDRAEVAARLRDALLIGYANV